MSSLKRESKIKDMQLGDKMLNPRWHQEFTALCAIPADELSEEEWALLQVHLAYCGACLKTFHEHQQRVPDVLPRAHDIADTDQE
jgi:hypothetical protein